MGGSLNISTALTLVCVTISQKPLGTGNSVGNGLAPVHCVLGISSYVLRSLQGLLGMAARRRLEEPVLAQGLHKE